MARDNRMQDYYLNLHEMQPPPAPQYHIYDLAQSNASAASAYELTAGACGVPGGVLGGGVAVPLPPPPLVALHHDPRKRKPSHYSSDGYEMADCDGMHAPGTSMQPAKRKPSSYSEYDMSGCDTQSMVTNMLSPTSGASKRKTSSYGASSTYDEGTDETRSTRTVPDKKHSNRQNHSEIEKRRRDKMNTYITELSTMVPMCGAMARKLDKLTVLRMAVQHLRSVRGARTTCPLAIRPRPAYLGERELNALVLQAAHDCFLLVVGCDRGRLLFVSASVKRMLHYDQSELLGQSLFDILHPKDVAKVKEQLSSSDVSPRERLIDAKTMLPVRTDVAAGASRLCPGTRRSFFCRIKCRAPSAAPADPESAARKMQPHDKKYCVVQFTGYLKSWGPAEMCEGDALDEDACNLSCLVAVGRALADLAPTPPPAPPARPLEFMSRHATDGKFLFVDQRVTLALGYLPQELLGTSLYEYVGAESLGAVACAHKAALLRREPAPAHAYAFRRKDGTYAHLHSLFKPFRNPWTKDVECLVAKNTVVAEEGGMAGLQPETSFDMFKHKEDTDMQRLINSQVESHKIGGAIAEEVLRNSAEYSPELPGDMMQDAAYNQQSMSSANVMYEQVSMADNLMAADPPYEVRNNVPLSSAGAAVITPEATLPPADPPLPSLGLDGNGEAAMAVIMSLLEADAGLGGPVNFSGLPWPLP